MPVSDSAMNRGLNCLTPARTSELQLQVFRTPHFAPVPRSPYRV